MLTVKIQTIQNSKKKGQNHPKFHQSTITVNIWWQSFQTRSMPRYTCTLFSIMRPSYTCCVVICSFTEQHAVICICTSHVFCGCVQHSLTEVHSDCFRFSIFKKCCDKHPCAYFFSCFYKCLHEWIVLFLDCRHLWESNESYAPPPLQNTHIHIPHFDFDFFVWFLDMPLKVHPC